MNHEFDSFDDVDAGAEAEPQSLSLMGGIAGGGVIDENGFGVAADGDKKKLAQQSILIGVAVTVLAFGALMAMRVTQKDAGASVISAESRQAMDDLTIKLANLERMADDDPLNPKNITALFRDTASIVAAIQNDPTTKQVPIEQVQMNPFTPVFEKTVAVEVDDGGARAEAERAAKLRALYAELARIEVQSLIGGGRPRAFIGGDLYKAGDTLGSFRVTAIDSRKIAFEAPGFALRDGEAAFLLGVSQDR
ncbi:MAG: hypothetical protein AAF800_09945 [Planctomycetota bacterium]